MRNTHVETAKPGPLFFMNTRSAFSSLTDEGVVLLLRFLRTIEVDSPAEEGNKAVVVVVIASNAWTCLALMERRSAVTTTIVERMLFVNLNDVSYSLPVGVFLIGRSDRSANF